MIGDKFQQAVLDFFEAEMLLGSKFFSAAFKSSLSSGGFFPGQCKGSNRDNCARCRIQRQRAVRLLEPFQLLVRGFARLFGHGAFARLFRAMF